MFGTVPPIQPPLRTNTRNAASLNRVGTIPNDNTNNMTTNNVAQNVVNEDIPQLLDSRGGSHVTNVPDFDKEDLCSWKDRFLVYLDGLKPYPLECTTAKAMWTNIILAHEGPYNTRDTKIAALRLKFNTFKALEGEKVNGTFTRLKCLLNDIKNNGVSIPQVEVNATFVNNLPRKWLSMNQTQRANNSIKNDSLATLYGKYNYEEGLIDLGTKMPSEYQQDYKKTLAYAQKIYNDPNMTDQLKDIYRALESRYVHEGRTIDQFFYIDLTDESVDKFTNIGFDCLLL
ncbi:hypothetical protein Tco_0905455 [Tanacetum coccineum]